MAIAVVTDSTADIPSPMLEALDITVIPLNLHFGSEAYSDGIDLTLEQFFHKLKHGSHFPTTSQPSVGAFAEVYNRLGKEGKDIVSVHISQKLSGTYASAKLAKDSLASEYRIEVVDTLQASMGIGLMAITAAKAAAAGSGMNEILDLLNSLTTRIRPLLYVDTLEYLKRGGRIGNTQAFIGGLLNFKPLLTLKEGEIRPVKRVRTRSRGLSELSDFVKSFPRVQELVIVYSTTPEEVEALVQEVEPIVPRQHISLATYGSVIATHVGPDAIGVFAVERED